MAEVGLALPEEIDEAPELWPGLDDVMGAFSKLSRGRAWLTSMAGASPLPISAAELLAHADGHGIARGSMDFEEFEAYIDALDGAWLEDQAKRSRKAGR